MNYHIIDTTLREGEQTPGVLFSIEEKKEIVDRLARIGIQEIEIGISSPLSACVPPLLDYCRTSYPGLAISLWSRCNETDIDFAASVRPNILSLSIPASDIHISNRLGKDREWVLEKLRDSIQYARNAGLAVAVGFEDATRGNSDFLVALARTAQAAGAVRIRLADTVGIASPASMVALIQTLQAAAPGLPIGVHTHNDFGMATGNAVAALEAGACSADGVVLGLGERTGCAPLEELLGYLSLIKGSQLYSIEQIKPLSQFVAKLAKRTIPGNRPLVGDNIFACESGLHVQGLQRDPRTYEPYTPQMVGANRIMHIGAKSGRAALGNRLQEMGLTHSSELARKYIGAVRNMATSLRRPLTDGEILELVNRD